MSTPDDAPTDLPARLGIAGEAIETSKLAALRPHVNRLRAVRTAQDRAELYVGWPENTDTFALAARVYDQARAFAQATRREDRLLEAPAVEVDVHVHVEDPVAETPAMTVLMDLSDLPLAQLEVRIEDLDVCKETLDWFLDVVVAGAWKIVES